MRQVFTSPRLENVEKVAQFLGEHGIEARITQSRSYRGNARSNFSYRESANEDPQPAVWVVKSEDQPKARQLLRELGLLDSGRSPTSYLPTSLIGRERERELDNGRKRLFRIKMGLLVCIAFALGLGLLAWRKPTTNAPPKPAIADASKAASSSAAAAAGEDETYVIATPSALATMLLGAELRAQEAAVVCVSVDGEDPSQAVLSGLQATGKTALKPRSACTENALRIDVGEYRTDGSGRGTVQVVVADGDMQDEDAIQRRTLEVQREDVRWRVKSVSM